jgi:FkbM family methyltransferase
MIKRLSNFLGFAVNCFKRLPFLIAVKILFSHYTTRLFNRNANVCYSQTGEDLIINHFLGKINNGFYIDVGCNDPVYISNTFYFYLKGWKGICIDANESLINKFAKIRPKDIAVYAAVSDKRSEVTLFEFEQNHYNTIEASVFEKVKDGLIVKNKKTVTTQTLDEILKGNLPKERQIDLLFIDVEGHDFAVLKSIDLAKYSPRMIVIEIHNLNLYNIKDDIIVSYLKNYNYDLVGYVTMNAYFLKKG